MKSVFFLLASMNVGGVEKSFLGLLSSMPVGEYDIHLGLLRYDGGLLDQVPKYVHIHEINAYMDCWSVINDPPRQTIRRVFKEGNWRESLILSILYFGMKISGNNYYLYRYLLRNTPVFPVVFDIAVAYAGPSQMVDYYICKKVRAKEKYGWIHFDISRFGIDSGMTRRLYKQYDKIYVVSKEARDIFVRHFPQFAYKTFVRYNYVDQVQIFKQADIAPFFSDDFQGKRILTVGRFSSEKGQRVAIEALRIIVDVGTNVKWYFVGDGKDLAYCRQLAENLSLSDRVVFLGLQTNPYGFMRDCDVYVQPSRHEGFCITLAEVLCFDKPVVTTGFAGAAEQLEGKKDAVITGFSPREIANGVLSLIQDK